jgi:hypothetical protein
MTVVRIDWIRCSVFRNYQNLQYLQFVQMHFEYDHNKEHHQPSSQIDQQLLCILERRKKSTDKTKAKVGKMKVNLWNQLELE